MNRLKSQGPLAVILLGAIIGGVLLRDQLSFEALAQHRDTLIAFRNDHYVLTAGGLVAAYIFVVTFSLPGATLATLTGGFLFGLFPGVVFNWLGAVIGATFLFLATRMGLGAGLAARMDRSSGMVQRVKRGLDENQWSFLFMMRLMPLVPFFVSNVVPALFAVPANRFIISTAIGILPGAVILTSVGAGLGDVFEAGTAPDLGILLEPFIVWPLIGLSVLALLPVVLKLWRREKF